MPTIQELIESKKVKACSWAQEDDKGNTFIYEGDHVGVFDEKFHCVGSYEIKITFVESDGTLYHEPDFDKPY